LSCRIPAKGKILTQISNFWFNKLKDVGPSHVIAGDTKDFPEDLQKIIKKYKLEGRSMLVKKLKMIPVEAIVRGYITGTAWNDYTKTGKVCGIALPTGLQKYQKLPEVIFTPSTKAESGHDENISFERACEIVGKDVAEKVRDRAIAYYTAAEEWARKKGIIIADTKMEFGIDEFGNLVVADEIFTPDCSRFWGEKLDRELSYDKQIVRNYLESIKYDKKTPVELPADVVKGTQEKYIEIYRLLTGDEASL
jgi:phosphoribosylaminoimidazole-succinocarboxamide synthase